MEDHKPLPSRGFLLSQRAGGTRVPAALWDSKTLPDQLELDRDLALRQYIQWLDKALRKPRSLQRFDIASYVARTHLGTCLWDLYAGLHFQEISAENADYKRYLARWQAKLHPYARHEVNWVRPETDGNAAEIAEAKDRQFAETESAFAITRWTSVFGVPVGASTVDDYREAAGRIEHHLRFQERTIHGKDRTSEKSASGYGLIINRGDIITRNATDPRDLESFERYKNWSEELEDLYFRHGDIARQIAASFKAEPRTGRPKQRIGAALYAHFEPIVKDSSIQGDKRQEFWNLHNRIRQFYRTIGESNRLLEALRSEDHRKLRFLLPQDKKELLDRVVGKRDASRLSRKIRLGKIIAHSIDHCSGYAGDDFNAVVHEAMDYYATSVGQSDIKRNEAFVRVLRNAVAFSIRTHATWLEDGVTGYVQTLSKGGQFDAQDAKHRDLTANKTAAGALLHMPLPKIKSHARLIFGSRSHDFASGLAKTGGAQKAESRTDALFDGTEQDREVLWGLLRLAALVRNRSYHFNTKKRFLNTLENGLLRSPSSKNALKSLSDPARDGSMVDSPALARLEALLDYDMNLDAQMLAQTLTAVRFHKHVPAKKRSANLLTLSRLPASDDRVTPKFMTLLRKGYDLATNDKVELIPKTLKPFDQLRLHDLSKDQGSVNHDKIGILRLLYNRAFPNWLEEIEKTPATSTAIFKMILDNKRARREAFLAQTNRVLADDELLADTLLENARSISDLEAAFAAESLLSHEREMDDTLHQAEQTSDKPSEPASRPFNPYVSDRTQQSYESGALESLRREIYSYLFAYFIEKSDFGWLWSITEPTESETTPVLPTEITRDLGEQPSWLRQFYAWLYLVPVDQIALLQHQFRKTRVLEEKARRERLVLFPAARQAHKTTMPQDGKLTQNEPTAQQSMFAIILTDPDKIDSLRAIDRVMGLYTRVQAAGFSGEEFAFARQLFTDGSFFDELLATGDEGETLMLPGTISGLQQLARLGTLKVLTKTFTKHRVTLDEARALKDFVKDSALDPFTAKQDLHNKLLAAWKEKPRNEVQLRLDVEAYRKQTAKVANYNFDIAGARLSDFTKTHHLLMSILGRLADFTAIWERDRDCVLLALAFDRDPNLEFVGNGKGDVSIRSSEAAGSLQIHWRQSGFTMLCGQEDFLSFTKCAELTWMQRFFGLPGDRKRTAA